MSTGFKNKCGYDVSMKKKTRERLFVLEDKVETLEQNVSTLWDMMFNKRPPTTPQPPITFHDSTKPYDGWLTMEQTYKQLRGITPPALRRLIANNRIQTSLVKEIKTGKTITVYQPEDVARVAGELTIKDLNVNPKGTKNG